MTGAVVWFTGLPSSGKSTLARRVRARLVAEGHAVAVLDSDELRAVLESGAYDPAERDRFYRSLVALAAMLARQDLVVLVAATAAHRSVRESGRAAVAGDARFFEVWVKTPLVICEARDDKGLYARARSGEVTQLPGIGVAFEPPSQPEVVADGGFDMAAVAQIAALLAPSNGSRDAR